MSNGRKWSHLDFGNPDNYDFDPGEVYTEDGFSLSVVTGTRWGVIPAAGNQPSALFAGLTFPIEIGDTISIKRNGGGRSRWMRSTFRRSIQC